MVTYRCLKYGKDMKDPKRKRKSCLLTHGEPKGCIWNTEIIINTLTNDKQKGMMIESTTQCKYLVEES